MLRKFLFVIGGDVAESRFWVQELQKESDEYTLISVMKPTQIFLAATINSALVLVGTALFRSDIDHVIETAIQYDCPIIDMTRSGETMISSVKMMCGLD